LLKVIWESSKNKLVDVDLATIDNLVEHLDNHIGRYNFGIQKEFVELLTEISTSFTLASDALTDIKIDKAVIIR